MKTKDVTDSPTAPIASKNTTVEQLESKEREISAKIELGRWNLWRSHGRLVVMRSPQLCAMKSDCIKAIAGMTAAEIVRQNA